jgi:hypothetical protein
VYTHRITYLQTIPHLGQVRAGFRTVADAVEMHVAALAKRHDVALIMVEEI